MLYLLQGCHQHGGHALASQHTHFKLILMTWPPTRPGRLMQRTNFHLAAQMSRNPFTSMPSKKGFLSHMCNRLFAGHVGRCADLTAMRRVTTRP